MKSSGEATDRYSCAGQQHNGGRLRYNLGWREDDTFISRSIFDCTLSLSFSSLL